MGEIHGMKVWEEGADFFTELKGDARLTRFLSEEELKPLLDVRHYLKNVDALFKRVFN